MAASRLVLLVQLPIPPPGTGAIEGNVPLAAAYLKLFARRQGLERSYAIELLPTTLTNSLGDQALIEAILVRQPWMVGFSCYLWNVERTLWIAERLKQKRPELIVLLGGPEITADNAWALQNPAVDYAVLGEGEQTFAQLLAALAKEDRHSCLSRTLSTTSVGMAVVLPSLGGCGSATATPTDVAPPTNGPHPNPLPKGEGTDCNSGPHPNPLPKGEGTDCTSGPHPILLPKPSETALDLDGISSPYIEGILDLAGERRMSLETVRGCRFRCNYCYYPKSHQGIRFLSDTQILANLDYAAGHGATEVVFLDPTLNGRPDFADFLRLLRRGNPSGRLTFSGELRAEGIDADLARLLREAGFREVEIGLQSVEPKAWELMGRPTNLSAFEQGVKAILAEGIKARVDLIVGLPGDTVDSVRRGIEFLHRTRAFSELQVFNLSILPGTAFRRDAEPLGLRHQPWPPYYVLQTPTLGMDDIYALMEEAQEAFGVEFDSLPPPRLDSLDEKNICRVDLDMTESDANSRGPTARGEPAKTFRGALPPGYSPSLAFTLWFRSSNFHRHRREAVEQIRRLLTDNPHTTLQVVLEPTGDLDCLTVETLESLLAACYETTTYLDRYYSLHPGRLLGSKRLIVLLPKESRPSGRWRRNVAEYATLLVLDQRR
jgi:radical SAM superfamily enzyme YgiQ (UPF0313 family)